MYYDHEISTVNNGRWWKVDNRIGADQGGLIKECLVTRTEAQFEYGDKSDKIMIVFRGLEYYTMYVR